MQKFSRLFINLLFISKMAIKDHIPNSITSLNLVSGSLGIYFTLTVSPVVGALFMGAAAIFDFADGFAARLLHAKSTIGKELDSLADVISFGLLPGIILLKLIAGTHNLPSLQINEIEILPFAGLFIPVFAALRLAKFNLDTRQTDSFLGLPTPASGLLIASLPLIFKYADSNLLNEVFAGIIGNFYFYPILVIVLCWLNMSEIPLLAMKFKSLSLRNNYRQFLLVAIALVSAAFFGFSAVPVVFISYIAVSVFLK